MINGIAASPGISMGKVLLKKDPKIQIKRKKVENIEEQIQRLIEARNIAKEQIQNLYDKTLDNIGEEEANIFKAHKMILDDPEFFGKVEEKIKAEAVNVEWALNTVKNMFVKMFENMENEYLKERATDIKDVTDRVIRILLKVEKKDLSNLKEDVVVAAYDLTPSDTAQMDKERVKGFITEVGGKTSHSAIMARTLGVPAVVGIKGLMKKVKDEDMIVFDGEKGEVYINPDYKTIEKYKIKMQKYKQFRERLEILKGQESISKDGIKVELAANIGTSEDIEGVLKNDAEGVGLYRTEFLYMNRDNLPTEEEQLEVYKIVSEKLEGKPVVIRTLDIGGDKDLPYLELDEEMNPFLGYRAIRICLEKKDIFKTQLRALLRASTYGNIKIMFPMISSIEELRKAKLILEEVKEELKEKNISYNREIEVGMMVEVPSVAVMSDIFAKEVDFFSIGTNDLLQYTTAVDRGNQKISHLYNQFHPALLRLIKMVIDNGHKEGIWVGMCGEVAGDPKLIPILLGMGLDEFSMSATSVLKARWIIKNSSKKEMSKIAQKLINFSSAEEVEKFIDRKILI